MSTLNDAGVPAALLWSPFIERNVQQHLKSTPASKRDGLQAGQSTVTNLNSRRSSGDDLHVVRDRTLYERRGKRPFDIVVGSLAAIAVAPLAGFIGAAVRVGLGKPVLYEQERIGENGERFTIYKFRTMRPDRRKTVIDLPGDQERRNGHKRDDDPRHTGLGRRLRQLSLDELPQMINVLRGEMSLVGPRPEMPEIAEERGYAGHIRHQVKPGMTGPYQTSDLRLNGDLRDGLHLDADYVLNVTLRKDVTYLVRTVKVLLTRATGS